MKIRIPSLSLVALFAGALVACADPALDPDTGITDTIASPCSSDAVEGMLRPAGWGELSHCKGVAPDYDLLFDDSVVHRIDITVSASDYQAAQDDLADLLGGGGGGRPGGGGPGGFTDEEPIYVPVTIDFDGQRWWQVGMRYKGNSSLSSAYRQGVGKLSFRLDFDEFEDENPEIEDQRFYGFKKMTFSNGYKDSSLIRDKLGGDIFRAAGIPVARSAFTRIYVDHGDGPVYFGLYTMIEDPANKMLESQFADDGGNLYKPDGDGAALRQFVEGDMIKKTNELEADYSDVMGFISALNGDRSDAAAWRAALEATFDVDTYLTTLAINQSMVNWDSYGWMTHNYYLYADPGDGGRLTYIPWDLNESLLINNGGPGGSSSSVLLDEISGDWPLIRNLLDDPVYAQIYAERLAESLAGPFEQTAVNAMMNDYHDLIAPYVVGPDGEQSGYTLLASDSAFETSVSGNGGLSAHVSSRHAAVNAALD